MLRNKENLRAEGEKVKYEPWMIQELVKCKEDIIHFVENYMYIVELDKGINLFKPYDYQKKILKCYINPPNDKRHIICMQPRQSGKTAITTAYLLHYALFNDDKTIYILANKFATCREIIDRIKFAYERLPLWLQVGIKNDGWNQTTISLENGSRIFISTTSSSSISGKSVSLLYIDEYSKIPENIQREFMTATYPVISSGKTSKIIITSTPLGMNLFYKMWNDAIRGLNNFYPVKVNYWENPKYDDEWRRLVISDIGTVAFNQEYLCVDKNTIITIKNKKTNKIERVKIGDFYSNYLEI